jgi:hypothetical protein
MASIEPVIDTSEDLNVVEPNSKDSNESSTNDGSDNNSFL